MEGTATRSPRPRRRRHSKPMSNAVAGQAIKLSSGLTRFPNVSKIYSALVTKKQEDVLADRRYNILLAVTKLVDETGSVTFRGDTVRKRRELKDVANMLGMDYTEVKNRIKEAAEMLEGSLDVTSDFHSGPLFIEQSFKIQRLIKKHHRSEQIKYLDPLRVNNLSLTSMPKWSASMLQYLEGRINNVCALYTPSNANSNDVSNLVYRIKTAVNSKIPNANVNIKLYGSRGYGLCNDSSDVDMVITSGGNSAISLESVFNVLRRLPGCRSVVHLKHAHSPIIRFKYFNRQNQFLFECDVSSENRLGLEKTQLISQYLKFDPRVAKVLTMVKVWSKKRQIADSNTLNSYGLTMMVIAFLISRKVVPPLQLINSAYVDRTFWSLHDYLLLSSESVNAVYTGKTVIRKVTVPLSMDWGVVFPFLAGAQPDYFYKGTDVYNWVSPNTQTATELLYAFFHYYGNMFDPLTQAVSPRLGAAGIPRSYLSKLNVPDWKKHVNSPGSWHNNMRLLVIEDVFEPSVNCGRNAPPSWVEGFLWEMRRAAWILTPNQKGLTTKVSPIDRLISDQPSWLFGSPIAWAPVYTMLLTWLEKVEKKDAVVPESHWKQHSLVNPEINKLPSISNRRR